MNTEIFEHLESNVRSYCRSFPEVFTKGKGSLLFSESGRTYIDFFSGAGSLNYGHNPDPIKACLVEYLISDSIIHGLDFYTAAKRAFLEDFEQIILRPRKLDYKIQFCGPTGTNAVEAALKLARKIKGRPGIFAFMGGYHGMSLGSLAATGNKGQRAAAGVPLSGVTFMPFPFGFMEGIDSIGYIEAVLNDTSSGIEKPSAILFESVQAEGGVIVAPTAWLQRLADLCRRHDILLICDDIQVGCGRTGTFFSFERAGCVPDLVILSKSISGYGLPLSMLLMKRELDIWKPAEHNGTFRGNQLAFVAGRAALRYWQGGEFTAGILERQEFVENFLNRNILPLDEKIQIRGLGLIWGIDLCDCGGGETARLAARHCFQNGLMIERSGREDTVLKILPPLNIPLAELEQGCLTIQGALQAVGISPGQQATNLNPVLAQA